MDIQAHSELYNVKVEVRFNPARGAYICLIGYENQKDSEKGVSVITKVVTAIDHIALYEVISVGKLQTRATRKDFQKTRAIVEYQSADTEDFLTPSSVLEKTLAANFKNEKSNL
jgi:hypothetical protein